MNRLLVLLLSLARRWRTPAGLLAALLLGLALAPGVQAQARVANPFAGATWYVNPDYAAEVDSSIAQETDPTLVQKMQTVKTYPTAVWLDRIAAIAGSGGRKSLAEHLNTALAQQQGSTPVVVKLVIYDLPGRDCAALASNGELSIAANPPTQPLSGLETYKTQYIDPIVNVLSNPAYANLRIVAVIEPDSLPNLVVNTSIPACAQAQQSGAYVQGIQYAITQLHQVPNVYQYLDIGHSGWLGWASNMTPAISLYAQVVGGTPAGFGTIDGFVTNVANTLPTREPFMNAGMTVGGQQLISASFYEFNPHIEEASYAQALHQNFVNAGFPASIGLLIDTSRNGWGGAARPGGPSTSTDLNTFVNATRIDRRAHRGLWCNPVGAGIGVPPQANPAGFFAQLQAFVWIKPPGESDGTNLASRSPRPDPNCDPANSNPLAGNTPTGAYPDSPPAGTFFPVQFRHLVSNAFPPIPTSTSPSFTLAASPAALTLNRGASGTVTLTLTRVNGFGSAVSFTATGLPSGVTASFSPATTSGTGTGSVLTLAASGTAALGAATVTVAATGGGLTQTTNLALTVAATATPDFSVSASPATLSVSQGASASSTLTLARTNGFASAVSFSASGLPTGVTASFSPASTSSSGTSSVLTLTASATATTGAATVTVTATGGGLTRSVPVALTVTSGGGGGGGTGGVTVTPVIASSSNYFNDQQVRLASTGGVSGLSVTLVIQRTTGVGYGGQYNTVGGSVTQASSVTASTLTYTYTLGTGLTLGAGTYTFAAQTSGSGTPHPMAGDTFTVTYTSGGQVFTQTGHF